MNKFIGIGRLTKDIELRTSQSGKSLVQNSIAINSMQKDNQGNYIADFFNIVIFNKLAENVAKYCSKGSQIAIEGHLNNSKSEKDGKTTIYTKIIVDNLTFLDNKNQTDNSQHNSENDIQTNNNVERDPYSEMGEEITLSDDDLPF